MSARMLWLTAIINFVVLPFTIFHLLLLKTPSFSSIKPYVVVTESMEPRVPTGSIIYAVKSAQYAVGDIVTFYKNNEYITHRIIEKVIVSGEIYFSTKGDANAFEDFELIHPSEIVGKIATVLPEIGNIVIFYKSPVGFVVGTIAPVAFGMLYILYRKKSILLA